ncbi:hypothetical protein O0L34_g11326 [Tuta absoluta]|nr:hypothetical protein O0L34_g11326 [Tuta absoluta]
MAASPRPAKVIHSPRSFGDNKKADDQILTNGLIKSAKRTGQLSMCNRGLGSVPDNVWKLDELILEEAKEVDFNRSGSDNWWNAEPLKNLDLSSNVIKVIPPNIRLLQHLITLKLHDNAISELPPEISELQKLSSLSLDHNRLTTLPVPFYKLAELRWLSISHNLLNKIHPDIGDLVMLKFLDLSHNKIVSLPPGMGYLVRLLELNLSHNLIEELPPDIVNLRELKTLNVSNNKLKALPAMGELRKMEVLEASHNEIEVMPNFYGCTALKEIWIAMNHIKELSDDFCDQMQQLSVLNIRDNKLEILPENVVLLKKLTRLDLTNNNLNKLPKNLGLLTQLQSINMDGNKFAFVRSDVLRGGTDRMMRFLRDRIVSESSYTEDEWPDTYTLKKSQALMLVSREISEVPEHLFESARDAEVHIVDISKNKLTSIPLGILNVKDTLSQLVLSSNCITAVPPEVGALHKLHFLDLSKNALSDLPDELDQLQFLRELVLSNNKFNKIPRCVYCMERLEILLLADNQLQQLDVSPGALANLRRLAVLDLRNNNLRTVPPLLGNFTQLRSLELMGNCFRQPRHAILEKGTETILSYLRDRIPADLAK